MAISEARAEALHHLRMEKGQPDPPKSAGFQAFLDDIESAEQTEKSAMVIDPAFVAIRRRIFVMFTARDGISGVLANEEFDRLQSVGGDMAKYLRVQRTGSKFPLNRSEKESLALTFDNAGNHASFEMYHD